MGGQWAVCIVLWVLLVPRITGISKARALMLSSRPTRIGLPYDGCIIGRSGQGVTVRSRASMARMPPGVRLLLTNN